MATSLQAGDILSGRVWCTNDEQASVNSYNFQVVSVTGGAVTDQDFSNALDLLTSGLYGPMLTTHSVYNGVQTYFLARTTGSLPAPVKTISSAGAGTASGNPVPPVTCAILKYSAFARGPRGRGRVYLPFVAVSFVSPDGTPTVAFDTLVNSFASAMLVPLTLTSGGSSATCVWSLVTRHPVPAPPTAVQLLQAESAAKFGQMHKRGSYGKPNVSPI